MLTSIMLLVLPGRALLLHTCWLCTMIIGMCADITPLATADRPL